MAFINYNIKNKVTIFPGIKSAMEHSAQSTFGCVTLEAGVVAPLHSHPHEQWTFVLEGEMEFTLDGETQLLLPGMGAFIGSNVLHGAKAVTACKVIDVFTPVREDYRELGVGSWESGVGSQECVYSAFRIFHLIFLRVLKLKCFWLR